MKTKHTIHKCRPGMRGMVIVTYDALHRYEDFNLVEQKEEYCELESIHRVFITVCCLFRLWAVLVLYVIN